MTAEYEPAEPGDLPPPFDGRVGILGAGTMGTRIALLCAYGGLPVTLWSRGRGSETTEILRRIARIEGRLANLDKDVLNAALARIEQVTDLAALAPCTLVIETIAENSLEKQRLLNALQEHLDDETITATNTSSLSVTDLGSTLFRSGRFLGLHFFNSPLLIRFIEIVQGEATSEAAVLTAQRFVERIGSSSVVSPDNPGFFVNRILFPLLGEAMRVVDEGCPPAEIDKSLRLGANHPMGPLQLADFIGLDVCGRIFENLFARTGQDKYKIPPVLERLIAEGYYGKKSRQGFYSY